MNTPSEVICNLPALAILALKKPVIIPNIRTANTENTAHVGKTGFLKIDKGKSN